jgi:molybdopterin-guanine dinucleotide biosynthesis protein A
LTGGSSSPFDAEKGILELNGKQLLKYVIDAVKGIVEEIIVVTNSQKSTNAYARVVSTEVRFVVDVCESDGPLGGAIAGFEAANGKYSALLPFDSPFVSREVLTLLFDCCVGKAATIPRWTNQEIEPLHAVYNTKQALKATKEALAENEVDIQAMVEKLRGIRYISTMVIEQLDPDFKTFFSVKTPLDLKKAAVMFKPRITSKRNKNPSKNR